MVTVGEPCHEAMMMPMKPEARRPGPVILSNLPLQQPPVYSLCTEVRLWHAVVV